MTLTAARGLICVAGVLTTSCGGASPSPAAPSGPQSFLAGTWQGTVTIQVPPGPANPLLLTAGATTWTFEVVPQTNLQTFKTTIRFQNSWLPASTLSITTI